MQIYSIMPTFTDHVDEICDDVERQYKNGVSDCALFMVKLVPEGNPPIDKAEIDCRRFDLFRDRLAKKNLSCGILVQCTIGHGYTLDNMFPFQPYVGFADGEPKYIACPYDEGFRRYIEDEFRVVASHKPATIMVDDDFRLIERGEAGCACPLHMAEFNRRAGTHMTREELWDAVHKDTPEGRRYRDIFVETQGDSLLGAARAMRRGIDAVDPHLPGSFCACGSACEFADDIAAILAGEGNPVVVRINNGHYTPAGAREATVPFARAAHQIAIMKDKVDVFLAETDTCPQNRYSTSAHSMHTQFVGSILEGVTGAKHWITRLATYEPNAWTAYRDILTRYAGFYNALSDLVPHLRPVGCRIPLSGRREFKLLGWSMHVSAWASSVLERFGIPFYFAKEAGGTVCMEGDEDATFTDDEIRDILSHNVFLASDTAKRLIDRGFGDLIGMDIREWTGVNTSGEMVLTDKSSMSAQMQVKEIVPLSDKVVADSVVYHIPDGETRVPLFPGVATYHNAAGGFVTVFSGTPVSHFVYYEAFSFLNETRKNQLIRLLRQNGDLPVYYPGDAEVYLRAAYTDKDELFCAFFNIGLDPIDEVTLVTENPVTTVEYLTDDGHRAPAAFRVEDGVLHIELSAAILTPVVLFLR